MGKLYFRWGLYYDKMDVESDLRNHIKREIECDLHNLKQVEKIAPNKLKKFQREFEANIKRYAKKVFGLSNKANPKQCFEFLKKELNTDWRLS